jgi:hypothetical protein
MFNCCNVTQKLYPVSIYNMGICCVCKNPTIYIGKNKIATKKQKNMVFAKIKNTFCNIVKNPPKQACLTPKNMGGSWHYYKNNAEYFFETDTRTKAKPKSREVTRYEV